ncbi:hypothetical protein ED733_004307 [Metarhizium rileyi]|uniref:Arb2 domain-containing protein n=1 Tax=Metarhizium rileyi (strain RCEF 4871) TaxID=1649241 RepID=A0A5C6GAY5_METRR|nr:hypothetical protein ED733_004307 [Metarhizium rileyi]
MFRRHWSGLPKDVSFPSSLQGLGYFVNDDDEIRSIKNPDQYFKFFINKNARVNQRQRFEFDTALEDIIHRRLIAEGLEKVALPLGRTTLENHIPVFASPDLQAKSRLIVFLGEPIKALGMLAGRVANGPGGINKGTVISVVKELQKQVSSVEDPSPPGILITNPGQLYWWPEGHRNLTAIDCSAIPLPSLVHFGRQYNPQVNSVTAHETAEKHIEYTFTMLSGMIRDCAKVDLIAIGQSCELITNFLDNEENWHNWKTHLNAMLLMGTVYPADDITNLGLRNFMAKRTRAYITSNEPLDTPLAPPSGNENEQIANLGCPCYSSSEPFYVEMVLIRALQPALKYLEAVALTPGYENDDITIAEKPEKDLTDMDWETIPDTEKPAILIVDHTRNPSSEDEKQGRISRDRGSL